MNQPIETSEWDQLFVDFHLLTLDSEQPQADNGWGLVKSGAVAVSDGKIAWIGSADEVEPPSDTEVIRGDGQFLSPGLIDCHTHLVFGGQRADEWQMRQEGRSYEEIARAGGGILSTVRATRAASEAELLERGLKRARYLIQQGVTCVEIKSGYGLDVETELKVLKVAGEIGRSLPLTVSPTLLGAHAVPPEYKGRPDEYIELVTGEMIPAAVSLATAVDVFTEGIAFDLKQTERVFSAAIEAGLAIKCHAEQLSLLGGARLAAEMGALSCDHLEYLDEAGSKAMAENGTVATLLPGAFYFLRETQKPPIALLRQYGVSMAIASDLNPGSSPVHSPLVTANMACTLFGLTPVEAIKGLTVNAAKALGVADQRGQIRVGQCADLVAWDIDTPAELAYGIGHNPCVGVFQNGKRVTL